MLRAVEPERDRSQLWSSVSGLPVLVLLGRPLRAQGSVNVSGLCQGVRRDELVERVDDQDRVLGMVVSRQQAIQEGWLHRVAVTVCRDERGRILVHRRSEQVSRFPGLYEVEVGGAANVGESYEQAAARELAEELGVRALPRLLFTFINRSGLSLTGSACTKPWCRTLWSPIPMKSPGMAG